MKILHIIDSLSMGGAENVLIGLSAEQIKLGHEVIVMPLVCPEKTIVRDKMEGNGVQVLPLLSKGSIYNPFLIIKIAKKIRLFDIVHVHLFPAFYWASFAKRISCCSVPFIYTEHSTNNRRRNKRILHLIDNQVYQYGYQMIIACSEIVLDSFRTAFPKVNHSCFINNGINTTVIKEAVPYSKKELLGVDDDTFIVTMVARFMPMKRQDTIVEALPKLPSKIHVVFVGGCPEDAGLIRVKNLASELKVSDRVHFLYMRDDVQRILKTTDVSIMASDYEGLSLSSIEGMAAGKPFVASNVDGLREVVGGYGVLFENKNSIDLANVLLKLKMDAGYYNDVASRCALRSMEFDVKEMTTAYLRLYNEMIQ